MFQTEEIRQRNEKMYQMWLGGTTTKEIAQQHGITRSRLQILLRIKAQT